MENIPSREEQRHNLRLNAELVKDHMEKQYGRPFGYTYESLKKLEDLIRDAKKAEIEHIENLLRLISCFLGECIIRNLGGEWQFDEEAG